MKRTLAARTLAAVLLLSTAACATGQPFATNLAVGRATRPDIIDKVPRILDQHGYQVAEVRDTGNVIQYMTSWITRDPFEDEVSRGASEARTRLTFEARQQGGEFYNVTIKAESMMQRAGFEGGWVNLEATPMFRQHLRDVADAVALEVDMGVRTR